MDMFCRSVFVLFILAALRILISLLVSSNSSYLYCDTLILTLPLGIRSITYYPCPYVLHLVADESFQKYKVEGL